MPLTYDDFLPLFGHCRDYCTGENADEVGLDFVRFTLANLAGAHPRTLAEFTGMQNTNRYEILYNKTKEMFFDFFQVYESRENSAFGLLDESYMAEFLTLLKEKGLIRMPKIETDLEEKIYKELGLLDSPNELMAAKRTGRPTRKLKVRSSTKPAEAPSKGNGADTPKKAGRPPSGHLEQIDLTRPIKLGSKEPSGKATVAIQIQEVLATFGRKKVTSKELIDALVDKDWGNAQARQTVVRLIRDHQYLDYA